MTLMKLSGPAALGAALLLSACAEEVVVAEPVVSCDPYPQVVAQVTSATPVYYGAAFEPGYDATDSSLVGPGDPNAVQYVVVAKDGTSMPLVSQNRYLIGDELYIVADTCNRAAVTVIQERG